MGKRPGQVSTTLLQAVTAGRPSTPLEPAAPRAKAQRQDGTTERV